MTTVDDVPWQVTRADWRALVDAALAGKTDAGDAEARERRFARLRHTTPDGIVLDPLADTGPDVDQRGLPGRPPFVRGAATLPDPALAGGWDLRSRVHVLPDGVAEANREVLGELAGGATSVWLDLVRPSTHPAQLPALLDGVLLDAVAIDVRSDAGADAVLAAAQQVWETGAAPAARGCLGIDPIGSAARTGGAPPDLAPAAEAAMWCADHAPGLRALVSDTTPYRDAGATDAEELALLVATGTAYVRAAVSAGLPPAAAFGQVQLRLTATADQFATIAKLRAARLLWARVADVAGVDDASARPVLHAVAHRGMLTRYDAWVNVLRGTVAAFAAAVGGADAVTVEPYDVLLTAPPSRRGRRLARTTQQVLQLEANLGRVLDPAGGSWHVETFTDALADAAWRRLQAIEADGGVAAVVASGALARRLAQQWRDRADAIAHRRIGITGVSEFPLLHGDTGPGDLVATATAPPAGGPAALVQTNSTPADPLDTHRALPLHRDAEAFEELRDRVERHVAAGSDRPAVLLLPLGALREHGARATFVANLVAAGGVAAVHPGSVTAEDVVAHVDAAYPPGSPPAVVCLCGTDTAVAERGAAVIQALRTARTPAWTLVAGAVSDAAADVAVAGVDEHVVAGSDAVAFLQRLLDRLGVPA